MSTPLTRRSMFGFAAALSCPLCPRAFAADAPHWGYEGATGPEHWGDLEADFRTCEIGTQQSPINLTGAVKASLRPVGIDYQKVPLRVWNNGRYIQINVPPGSQVNLAGVNYQLLQFHFHHPSEHLLDGERFDMEAHFVNKSADGSLCALGVFIKRGLANPVLEPVVAAMPSQPGSDIAVGGVLVDPRNLGRPVVFRVRGVLDHPALPGDGELGGVPHADRSVAGADRALRRSVSNGRATNPAAGPTLRP